MFLVVRSAICKNKEEFFYFREIKINSALEIAPHPNNCIYTFYFGQFSSDCKANFRRTGMACVINDDADNETIWHAVQTKLN